MGSRKKLITPLRLAINLEQYGSGEFEDRTSAIARPWRRLFQEGFDPGIVSYLVVQPLEKLAMIVGCICETSAKRLLFFPGCKGRALNTHFTRKAHLSSLLRGTVDHITFENGNRRRHITQVLPTGKRSVPLNLTQARTVDTAMYAWFGVTLQSLNSLDTVPGKLWFAAESPASDVERRLELFRSRGSASRVCQLTIPELESTDFLQINFFIDYEPHCIRNKVVTFLPKGPPELCESVEIPDSMSAQLQGLEIYSGGAKVKIHPIAWKGKPRVNVGFGF